MMSDIFGIFFRDGRPFTPDHLETILPLDNAQARRYWDVQYSGSAGMGQHCRINAPQEKQRRQRCVSESQELILVATGRVDNREDLMRQLSFRPKPGESSAPTESDDAAILLKAYRQWGENCPARIYGDWSLAAWHPAQRRLFLARDHFGTTALYYYADARVFAFASSRQALLDLNLAPMKMDELYFAQVLLSWPACHGERTIHSPIKRLPPAHSLTVNSNHLAVRQYWWLEHTPELHLPRRTDYVETFRELFDEAVRCRLRSTGEVAVSLSGGLDSGSVAATAAECLSQENRRLFAYTSVPLWDTESYQRERVGNEWSLAQATAEFAGNMDLHKVTAATMSPIRAIRDRLSVNHEPVHATGNFFWLQAVRKAARGRGCEVLLTGQMGNAGISWTGSAFSQELSFQLRHFGWRNWPTEFIKRYTPAPVILALRTLSRSPDEAWRSTALHPDLARRLNLGARCRTNVEALCRTPLGRRFLILKPGRSLTGLRHAESGAACGLEIRDPTADVRVLSFAISVPDSIFMDPETGLDRWLIREAMRGRLPDSVRLNRKRGRQSADLVPRLRSCGDEVEAALKELATGPACAYVNVPFMRNVWTMIQTCNTPQAYRMANTILTRGIMAGLWVNGFFGAT